MGLVSVLVQRGSAGASPSLFKTLSESKIRKDVSKPGCACHTRVKTTSIAQHQRVWKQQIKSAPARNRTWSSTFAESRANPAHSEDCG